MSGIDIVIEVYKLLNVASIRTLLGNGKVWQHNRPLNSDRTDIVISVGEYRSDTLDSGYVDVNIHTQNLVEYYPIDIEDKTFPDLAKLKQVTDAVLPLLVSGLDYALYPDIIGIPTRDKDGHWYVNIRVKFESIDAGKGVDLTLMLETSTPDGYGGAVMALSEHWVGVGAVQNIARGSQLNLNVGRFEFNLNCDFLLPIDTNVQKNMQVHTNEGEYVIRGIVQDGNFWRVNAARKDGVYGVY